MSRRPTLALAVLAAASCAPAQSVAVLALVNQTPSEVPQSSALEWIGESIAETVRDALAAKGLVSFDRDGIEAAVFSLRLKSRVPLTQASVLKIGEALDAEQVLYGSFAFTPAPGAETRGSLRISARLIDRGRLRDASEFAEDGPLEELARLETHLAWRVLSRLAPRLAPPETESSSLRPPVRLDAEENYIRGLLAPPASREKFFKQAATLDPRFSAPCFELGRAYYQARQFAEAARWLERVAPSDVRYRDASFSLGLARFEMGDYPGAQRAFQTIAAAVPLNEVFNNLGAAESRRSLPQAADSFRKALEGDPNDPDYHFNLGYVLWKRGDFPAAADQFRAVVIRDPDDEMATLLLGRCLRKQGLRPGGKSGPDARFLALERLKPRYEERAWRQLKLALESPSQ